MKTFSSRIKLRIGLGLRLVWSVSRGSLSFSQKSLAYLAPSAGMVLSILFFRNVGVVGDRKAKPPSLEENQTPDSDTPISALDEKKRIALSEKEPSPAEDKKAAPAANSKES